jgi:putative flippase GtrA
MLIRQFISYGVVGVLSAVVDIGTMQSLLLTGASNAVAVTVAFLVGLIFNYLCQQRLTFRAQHSTQSALRFLCVVSFNYLLTLGFVYTGLWLLDSALLGKLASLPVVAAIGFVAGRYWIFPSVHSQNLS